MCQTLVYIREVYYPNSRLAEWHNGMVYDKENVVNFTQPIKT